MFFHENEYLNYHLTTVVNCDNFTFCGTTVYYQMMSWKLQIGFIFFQMLCAISKLSIAIIN